MAVGSRAQKATGVCWGAVCQPSDFGRQFAQTDTKSLACGKTFAFILAMIVNINLSRFAKRKKVPPVSPESFIDLAGKAVDDSPASPSLTVRTAAPSRLIDHGKAPLADSRSPQPVGKHRPAALVDHGKHDLSADAHRQLPTVSSAASRAGAARLIDLGKVT
jgi:hypothetical protein